jgi:hypothetical protein
MKTGSYIKELKNNLKDIDSTKRTEIVNEIKSYIIESKCSYETLVEKFGTAQELADSYMEDEPKVESFNTLTGKYTNLFLKSLGVVMLIIVGTIKYFIYTLSSDGFDYSKYDAKTVDKEINANWKKIEMLESIIIDQSHVVFYGSDNDYLEYSCARGNSKLENNTLSIVQNKCYVRVPNKSSKITIKQSEVVLIKINTNLIINAYQSRIKVAEAGAQYFYDLELTKSEKVDLQSSENSRILIKAKLNESKIERYVY